MLFWPTLTDSWMFKFKLVQIDLQQSKTEVTCFKISGGLQCQTKLTQPDFFTVGKVSKSMN